MSNNPFATTSNQEIQPSSRFNYADWRERFILTILQIGCVFAIPMIVLSFPTASISDRILFIGSYIGLAAITVLPSPYLVRVYALLFTLFAVGVNAILSWGPWADGNIFLLACVLLSALFIHPAVPTSATWTLFLSPRGIWWISQNIKNSGSNDTDIIR